MAVRVCRLGDTNQKKCEEKGVGSDSKTSMRFEIRTGRKVRCVRRTS